MWGIIATWRMAKEGVEIASELLNQGKDAGEAIEKAIIEVENFPYYKSVGYGGLPNEEMEVELDAAYMDGDTLDFGAVGALQDIKNPISVAKALSKENKNNMIVARGAKKYAKQHGFIQQNMLSERAMIHYKNRIKETQCELKPYNGHDTVGMVSLDKLHKIVSATSTSGLFMKKKGRLGDSAIIGSGFYADSMVGGAVATGLGEDLMKGCISYEIVSLIKQGMSPQDACDHAVTGLIDKLQSRNKSVGDISVVAMSRNGEWGASSNIEGFSFVVATSKQKPSVYLVKKVNGKTIHELASDAWLEEYMATRMAPLKEL